MKNEWEEKYQEKICLAKYDQYTLIIWNKSDSFEKSFEKAVLQADRKFILFLFKL